MRMLFIKGNSTGHITLDTGNCKACWECIDACPNKVLGKIDFRWHKHAKIITPKKCTGCLACINACKYGAISDSPASPLEFPSPDERGEQLRM